MLILIQRLNKQENALDTLESARPKEIYSQGLEEVGKVISHSLEILFENIQRMNTAPEDPRWVKKRNFPFCKNLNSTSTS